ncbi:hypothetical protein [Portibacter lacus]
MLVVIGIIIALQLNTYNEHLNKKAEISCIYLSVKEELQNDVCLFQ